jgi:hypothetical protein
MPNDTQKYQNNSKVLYDLDAAKLLHIFASMFCLTPGSLSAPLAYLRLTGPVDMSDHRRVPGTYQPVLNATHSTLFLSVSGDMTHEAMAFASCASSSRYHNSYCRRCRQPCSIGWLQVGDRMPAGILSVGTLPQRYGLTCFEAHQSDRVLQTYDLAMI